MESSSKSNVITLNACPGCGAEVRLGSEFCYNCGGSLSTLEKTAVSMNEVPSSSENGRIKNGPGSRPAVEKVRRRTARIARANEPVQVVWKRDEGIGMSYILLSAAAAFLVIVLIAIAYYLR